MQFSLDARESWTHLPFDVNVLINKYDAVLLFIVVLFCSYSFDVEYKKMLRDDM